ncbi:MAG: myristoyl transferase, partial [Bacillota bacterium]
KEDPATAAAITRGMMRGAKWVAEHPDETAKLIVEKKYIPGNPELVAKLLKNYNYVPSVDGGEQAVDNAARETKAIGLLDPLTNIDELKKRVFIRLKGVN